MQKCSFEAIGTHWSIETAEPLSPGQKKEILQLCELFDAAYSRFRPDSIVTRASQKAGTYTFPPEAARLFDFYESLYAASDGACTPLVGEALVQLGYDAGYSLKPRGHTHKIPLYESIISRKGSTVTLHSPALLDFGAAGKGYLVDLVAEILESMGFAEYIVDASGDFRHRGPSAVKVGLEHPNDTESVIGVLLAQNQSLCASATNRRAWGNGLHHVIDPKTGEPTQNIRATWVCAADTMTADGLATALFFCNPTNLARSYDFSFVRYHANNTLDHSAALNGELYA